MANVFLSYASDDRPAAVSIAKALTSFGWTVWWDSAIKPGEDFDFAIEMQLEAADCVVVLWSAVSAASRWVRAEATEALRHDKLIPVLLEDCRPPLVFRQLQIISTSSNLEIGRDPALLQLQKAISARLARLGELRALGPPHSSARTVTDRPTHVSSISPDNAPEVIVAFFQGVGLPAEQLEHQRAVRVFKEAGKIIRECLAGAAKFLSSQEYLRGELKIERTQIVSRGNKPLKFIPNYETIVRALLMEHSSAFMGGAEAMREAMQDVQSSSLAHLAAMRATVLRVFEVLDPTTFASAPARSNHFWRWGRNSVEEQMQRNYRQKYDDLVRDFQNGEGIVFDTFRRTYLQQLNELRSIDSKRSKEADQ